jgi:hypothetical protein
MKNPRTKMSVVLSTRIFNDILPYPGRATRVTEQDLINKTNNVINILNLFECDAGWPLTRMYDVKTINTSAGYYTTTWPVAGPTMYFVGSNRWIRSPYMASLFMLIVKAAINDQIKCADTVEECISKSIEAIIKKEYRAITGMTIYLVTGSIMLWPVILRGYDRLFGDKPATYYWDAKNYTTGNIYGQGIQALINNCTSLNGLDMKLANYMMEQIYGKKQ